MLQQHAHCAWVTTIMKMVSFAAYGACWICLCCHIAPNSDTDFRIFIARTNVNVCDCTRGCTDTVRDSALKVDYRRERKNPSPRRGIEPVYLFAFCVFWSSVSQSSLFISVMFTFFWLGIPTLLCRTAQTGLGLCVYKQTFETFVTAGNMFLVQND